MIEGGLWSCSGPVFISQSRDLSLCLSVFLPLLLLLLIWSQVLSIRLSAAALSSRSHASGRRAMELNRSEQLLRHTLSPPLLGAYTSHLCND